MKCVIAILLIIEIFFVNYGSCTICQNVPTLTNFQPNQTLGKWYITAREQNISHVITCPSNIASFLSNTKQHFELKPKLVQTNSFVSYTKTVQYIGNTSDGKYLAITTDPVTDGTNQILDFDGNHHMLIYQCNEDYQVQTLFLLTRKKSITSQFLQDMIDMLPTKGVNGMTLIKTVQDCSN